MPNDLNGWPWILDTPGVGVITSNSYILKKVRWVSPSAIPGHEAIIQDKDARVIFHSVAVGENYVESELFENTIPISGLIVPTLDSGILYLYYEISGRQWPARAK